MSPNRAESTSALDARGQHLALLDIPSGELPRTHQAEPPWSPSGVMPGPQCSLQSRRSMSNARPTFRYKSDSTRNGPWRKGKARDWPTDELVDQWLAECCVVSPPLLSKSSHLLASWLAWCEARKADSRDRMHLGRQLGLRGFPAKRRANGYWRFGLRPNR